MAETQKRNYNPVLACYTKLYTEQFMQPDNCGIIYGEAKTLWSWFNVMNYFVKQNYLFSFTIKNAGDDKAIVAYHFNDQLNPYPYVKERVQRQLGRYSLNVIPMGQLLAKKKHDEFSAQYRVPVEYISIADRCVAELNAKIKEQQEKQNVVRLAH